MTQENTQKTEEKALVKTDEKAVAPVPIGQGGVQINSLEALWRFSQYVVESGFAPKGMERPASCLIAIEMGLEVGLRPMQSLQNIAVINGRPSVWGDAAKALVEASGLCKDFAEWFEGDEGKDDFRAICEVKRAGRSRPVRWEFSIADAKRAGLWGKQGPWTQYPKRMLQMRARGFAIRDGFADVMRGLALVEEVQDYIDVNAAPSTEASGLDAVTERLETKQKAKAAPKSDPAEGEAPFEVDEETGEILESETPAEEESDAEPAGVGAIDEESLF